MVGLTRFMLISLGSAAVIIGLMIFLAGPHSTATVFDRMIAPVLGSGAYSGGLEGVNTDNEMRFYSVFWIAYGLILFWLAGDMKARALGVHAALLLFFLGGIGRVLSYLNQGPPDHLFTILMIIELSLPVAFASGFEISRRGGRITQ